MKRPLLCAAVALLAAPLVAQTYYYSPSNTPGTGTCNVIPFGTTNTSATWVNQRYQQLVLASDLGSGNVPLRICSLAWSSCGSNQVRLMAELKITLAQTNNTTLSATFASNLTTNAQVVFNGKCHIWQTTGNNWSNIGLQKNYVFIPQQGRNLVIEIIAIGNHLKGGSGSGFHRTNNRLRAYAINWTGTPPTTGSTGSNAALKVRIGVQAGDIDKYGMPCGGSLRCNATGTPRIGQTVAFNLSGGPNTGVGFLWLGLGGKFPTPIDVSGLIGTPGCKLACALDLLVPAPFSGGSSTPLRIPIPNDRVLACFRIASQGFLPGTTNQLSDCARVLIGL